MGKRESGEGAASAESTERLVSEAEAAAVIRRRLDEVPGACQVLGGDKLLTLSGIRDLATICGVRLGERERLMLDAKLNGTEVREQRLERVLGNLFDAIAATQEEGGQGKWLPVAEAMQAAREVLGR